MKTRSAVRALVTTAAAAALLGYAALPALAVTGVTSGDTTTANVSVNGVIALTALTPTFTLTGAAGATVTGESAVSMVVTTNNTAGYSVTVQSASATLNPANTVTNPDTIPIANLKVREHVAGDAGVTTGFTALSSTSPVTVHSQGTRSAQAGDAIVNDYTVAIPFVNQDTYSATLNYVATTL